jgi:hypothetical protein
MKKALNLLGLLVVAAVALAVFNPSVRASVTGYLYGHGLFIQSVPGTTVASISNAGALTVTSISGPTRVAATAMSTTANLSVGGQLLLPVVSSTTIATLVPAAAGALVYNSTRFAVCVGTAATAGSWIFQSTNPITTAGISCKE